MNQVKHAENYGKVASLQAGLVTLAITPGYSYDAFNAVKLVFLGSFGASGLLLIILNIKSVKSILNKWTIALMIALMASSIFIFLFSGLNLTQSFYGVSGRNTGFLAFFSFLLIMLSAALVSTSTVRSRIVNALLVSALISISYSLLQYTGNDPVGWDSPSGSSVIGFLGNPNFQSAFLAISAIVAYAKLLDSNSRVPKRILYVLIIAGSIIGMVGANATQGFIVLFLGIAAVSYFFARSAFKTRVPSRLIIFGSGTGLIVGVLDIIQKVPWDPFLYGETISFRGDFWRAGWNMMMSHPIFGVGFDGYLNFYRRSRDVVASTRPAAETPTDAAHNVFLDYASNGGAIFLVLNLLLIVLIAIAGIKFIFASKNYDSNFAAIFSAWLGYLAQAVVSINQIGLAVWGWLLGGLILGVQKVSVISSSPAPVNSSSRNKKKGDGYFGTTIALTSIIGGMTALPIFTADHKFKLAVDSRQALDLYNSALSSPKSTKVMVLVGSILNENKIYKDSLVLSKEAVEFNPDSFEAWIVYASNPLLNEAELEKAKGELARLDPNINKLGGIDKYLAEKLAQTAG